jgi:hypothetical protein
MVERFRDRPTSRKPLGRLTELSRPDLAAHPFVEKPDDSCARLQTLSPYRPDSVGCDVCARIHENHLQDTSGFRAVRAKTTRQR